MSEKQVPVDTEITRIQIEVGIDIDVTALKERVLYIRDVLRSLAAVAGFAWLIVELYPSKVHSTHDTQEEQQSADIGVQPLDEIPEEFEEDKAEELNKVTGEVGKIFAQQNSSKKVSKLTQPLKNENELPCCDSNTNTRGLCAYCSNDSSAPRLLRSKIVAEETPPPKPPRLLRYRYGMDE